ncbi:MAG: LPS export ABC transporter periplasmic protein LptC [Bacteroidales bacterium]|nr:LPS export ABC transporter periplasmic protein LptC [Bacteroidales bacterium]
MKIIIKSKYKNPNKLYYTCFICLLLFSSFQIVYSQQASNERIELVKANSLEYDKTKGENVRRLIGDVALKHKKYLLYCDSAYLYSETNTLTAFSNVRIVSGDTLNVTGNYLNYNGNTQIAELKGKAKLSDKKSTLLTEQLIYNMKDNTAYYPVYGNITNPTNTLNSKTGYYFAKAKKFVFHKDVNLVSKDYTIKSDTMTYHTPTEKVFFNGPTKIYNVNNTINCNKGELDTRQNNYFFYNKAIIYYKNQSIEADSIVYYKDKKIAKAFRKVIIIDTTENIIILGNKAIYRETDSNLRVSNQPVLIMHDRLDSLYLGSDSLFTGYNAQNKERLLLAYHNVRFFRQDLQGKCDSLIYKTKDSLIIMFKQPILWSDSTQMSADTVNIVLKKGKIESVDFFNNSFIISRYDTSRYDQIKGKNMKAFFKDNDITKISVKQNAEIIYNMAEDNGSLIGINKSAAPDVLIYINDNKINKVVQLGNTEGTVFPESKLPASTALLKNFKWEKSKRPLSKYDITGKINQK